jgi:HAD superfamily hydrolase (TIGR01484 family)
MGEMKRIKLLAVDIDGCLTAGEGQAADLEVLGEIQKINERSKTDPDTPAVTLCTGRQQPFVDLMAQMIHAHKPAIFENGAGLYLPDTYEFLFNPAITPAMLEELAEFKQIINKEMVAARTAKIQPGKEVSLSVYPEKGCSVKDNEEQLRGLIAHTGFHLFLDVSILCINILFPGIDKGEGVRWLCRHLGLTKQEVGAVGDAPGDLASFAASGFSGAPANAEPEVRAAATFTAPHENGRGVLDIIAEVTRKNKKVI